MTNSDRKRLVRSGAASAGIWILILALAIFVPMTHPEKNVRLPAVHIVLTAVPAVSVPAPASPASPAKSDSKPAEKTPASPATVKSSPVKPSAPPKNVAAQSDSGGLGIPNFSRPVAPSVSPASSGSTLEFASENVSPVSSGSASTVREFEGTAANVETKSEGGLRGTSSGTKAQSGSASADTSSTLAAVASGAAGSSRSSSASDAGRPSAVAGSASPSSAVSVPSVPGLSFDGASRKLLSPASPAIVLPDRLARLIDSDRSVTVRFTVLADGSVPAALVEFTPQAVLPAEIRDWLRREFSRWRFEKASSDGQAQFLYSIRVK